MRTTKLILNSLAIAERQNLVSPKALDYRSSVMAARVTNSDYLVNGLSNFLCAKYYLAHQWESSFLDFAF